MGEIFMKSVSSFEEGGLDESLAYTYASLSFFGGVIILFGIDFVIHLMLKQVHHKELPDHLMPGYAPRKDEPQQAPCVCMTGVSTNELEDWHQRAAEELVHDGDTAELVKTSDEFVSNDPLSSPNQSRIDDNLKESALESNPKEDDDIRKKDKLHRMGMTTAIAIALHNFPEGLATFVAALNDPKVGAVLAVAIGIHNVPEGLCVALPIYYASGSRWKGFLYGTLSGIAEPVAAIFGWLVLATVITPFIYAILFGVVAGIMIAISIKELLPTSHRYDPKDTVSTYSFFLGMAVMSVSLVLFMFI